MGQVDQDGPSRQLIKLYRLTLVQIHLSSLLLGATPLSVFYRKAEACALVFERQLAFETDMSTWIGSTQLSAF
jgi:hypothetical protein